MDVQDSLWIGLEYHVGDLVHESSQDDEINRSLREFLEHRCAVGEVRIGKGHGGNPYACGPFVNPCAGIVGADKNDVYGPISGEISGNVFGVATVARSEDGYSSHFDYGSIVEL